MPSLGPSHQALSLLHPQAPAGPQQQGGGDVYPQADVVSAGAQARDADWPGRELRLTRREQVPLDTEQVTSTALRKHTSPLHRPC